MFNWLKRNLLSTKFAVKSGGDCEEPWEVARDCQNECDHDCCPFQTSYSEIFDGTPLDKLSSTSLVRKISSTSLLETTNYEQIKFLSITHLVPLQNQAVIVHWCIKSTYGIREFKVLLEFFRLLWKFNEFYPQIYLDGSLKSTVSSKRKSAFIDDVNMSLPHQFIVSIATGDLTKLPRNYARKLSLVKPAVFIHIPEQVPE